MARTRSAALAVLAIASFPAAADLAVSAHDNKVVTDNGTVKNVATPPPDTVSIIDMAASPPKIVPTVNVPTSVVGPPLSIAITGDESLAFVTAAQKFDPPDATKMVPDNTLSVIDLKANAPAAIPTLQ